MLNFFNLNICMIIKVIKSLQVLQRTETQWNILVEKIFDLEDRLRNMNSMDKRFKPAFQKPKNALTRIFYSSTIGKFFTVNKHF